MHWIHGRRVAPLRVGENRIVLLALVEPKKNLQRL
jgi:hypothetical protein